MKKPTVAIILLFLLSGASGLIYQLSWIRLFSQLLGGTTVAISTVLAAFMGGLALGSWRLGRYADRSTGLLRLYAVLELAVAVCGLAVLVLVQAAKPVYVSLAQALPDGALPPVRALLAIALVLPPTFFMGGTLPVLGRLLVRRRESLGRGLGLLYFANTIGAVAGAYLTGFVLIPALGVRQSVLLAVLGNLVAGGVAWLLSKSWPAVGLDDDRAAEVPAPAAVGPHAARGPVPGPRFLGAAFAVTGFAAMGCELYWTRALHHLLGNTTYAFSAMLTTYLFGLALGSWLGGRLADRVVSPTRLLGWSQVLLGVTLLATVPLIWNWLPQLEGAAWLTAHSQGWNTYLGRRFLVAALVMIVPTVLSGMTFPLFTRIGIADLGALGGGVGRLYAANTAGAIAGSLMAGFVILPAMGARRALLATALLGAGLGALLVWRGTRGGRGRAWAAIGVVAAIAVAAPALDRAARAVLSDTQDPADVVLFDREDATAETRVYRKANGQLHMSVDNRHIGGTEPGIVLKEKILAHVPIALAPRAHSVLAVGLGSGVTLGTLGLYDEVRRLTCVEIVPSVAEGARLFAEANHRVMDDPRLDLVIGDGIQYLLTTNEKFDVISSDSKLNPDYVGNSATLAREYYQLCLDHLTEGGIVAQWTVTHFPMAETRTVTATFIDVFPYVELFWIEPSNVILVGSNAPIRLDADLWRARMASPEVRADLKANLMDDADLWTSYRVAGRQQLQTALAGEPINTWMRPLIEFTTVREFQIKQVSYHEDDTLRWLLGLWAPEGLALAGPADAGRAARYREASHLLLQGYARGGGLARLDNGRADFAAAAAANPEDLRPPRLLAMIDGQLTGGQLTGGGVAENNADHWLRVGLGQLEAGQPVQALASFDRALALAPESANARHNRLLALRQAGRTQEAASEIDRFVRDFPRDARGVSLRGRVKVDAGDLKGAAADFERAFDLDPTTAVYANNLAVTLARLGRNPEAGATFAKAWDLDPSLGEPAHLAAVAYARAGDAERAWFWLVKALDNPRGDPSRYREGSDFAALRASSHWDPARIEAAVAQWTRQQAGAGGTVR